MPTPLIFQITQEDLDRSDTLEPEDLGKWCYISNGCISGFYESKEELLSRLQEIFS